MLRPLAIKMPDKLIICCIFEMREAPVLRIEELQWQKVGLHFMEGFGAQAELQTTKARSECATGIYL